MGGCRRDLLLAVFAVALISIVVTYTPAAQGATASTNSGAAASGATYVGSDICQGCHQEQTAKYAKTKMAKVFASAARTPAEKQGCEGCHGPGSKHVEAGGGKGVGGLVSFRKGAESAKQQAAVCQKCHEKGQRLYWEGGPHEGAGVTCTNCHKVMENVSAKRNFAKATELETCFQCHQLRRAQLQRSSHMPIREGKLTCTSCHNPHGSQGPRQLKQNTINENCVSCHTERRGPFLWEHPPVVENCGNCHTPHGSTNPFLLKVRVPRLCQECHNYSRHPSQPYDPSGSTANTRVLGRGCVQCHPQIHGSNHPSGSMFHR